ncbi:SGNH/GDSL hydrolase family protein [Pedobacter xixiisoli]|uniref:N-terminus of Esterase_SGNH_hydro-type n=1 Tax=Pedobacter xixiisoli TaxID=1476464 RepID=A0A286AF46_9SPHI|nr:SGNH/GDSL hydrolase family protein [Pedobacter xixiisoli]SOD20515.1 N-terminus of Esterase_SGNH_hydro-type [Pedobacter xixiisoli]
MLKRLLYTVVLATLLQNVSAQVKFYPAKQFTMVGKAQETDSFYHRLDTNRYKGLPPRIVQLLSNTAGLAISFKTNSTSISAKWCVSRSRPNPYLTPIANKGLDLYVKIDGKWQFAGIGKNTALCSDEVIINNMDNTEKEFLLYLPLYDVIRQLEIGVDNKAKIESGSNPFKHKVLIYGSSIVQGASASRPGMAYPAKLSRLSGINFINLGFSGSAKMEPAVADMVASVEADAYILDCVPNSTPQEIKERTAYLVNTIRKKHPKAPIIVMQSVIRERGFVDKKMGENVRNQNLAIQSEVLKLLQANVKDLYFITSEKMLGFDHEGSVDGTHPNDLGFERMVNYIYPIIKETLSKHGIN